MRYTKMARCLIRIRALQLAFFLIVFLLLSEGAAFPEDRSSRFVMENGLKVILQENRHSPAVALQMWVKVGSADEGEGEAGICHFIEHMLFKGTEKRKTRLAGEVEALGGTFNAYTSYDQTVYHITVASRFVNAALDVLADAIQHSTFDPAEVEREREVVLEEIRMGRDSTSRKLFQQTMSALYDRHPYRRPIIGYERTIRAITRDDLVSFFRRWYVPNRMVFVAAGEFDLKAMEKWAREAFREMKPSPDNSRVRITETPTRGVHPAVSYGNLKETYLQIAFPIPSVNHEDTPALDLLSYVLGMGEASRLVRTVRLEKGLVHSISVSSYTPKDPGAFIVGATLRADDVETAVGAILEELSRLEERGVTAEELHRVKVNVQSSLIYDRQTVQGVTRKLGYYETIPENPLFEKEYMTRIGLLESGDLQRMIGKYFRSSRVVVSVLAPSEKEEVLKNLSFQSVVERKLLPAASGGNGKEVFSRHVLDNGIRVIVKENRSLPTLSLQASFLGGVRFEDEAQNGISHFTAVMWTKGTKRRDSLQIAKKAEEMAGSLSGFSGYNGFGLTFTFLSQHVEEAFSLFAEVLKEPAFDPEEMEKRRRLILAAIEQQDDELSRLVFQLFRRTLYDRHPYRMDTLGRSDTVRKLAPKDLREFYERAVVPENMVLTVVGDADERQILPMVKRWFGDLKKGTFSSPEVPKDGPLREIRRGEVHKKKEQAHFVLGFTGATLKSEDRFPMEVLDAALSGQGGRFFIALRDRESLAYAVDFVGQVNLDPGFIGVYMGTHPEKLETAIEAVKRELRKVKEEGLTEEEVERAKRYVTGNFEIGLQTNGAQANLISLDELYGLGYDHFRSFPKEIEKVSREDVNRVARKYIDMEAYAIAIIRPPVEKK